ncbi:ankyrin repeat-containing domain protein [Flammula alnicola]|nr:ankyrin repeat-containing domain protein [Flammula alnicola]
MRDILAQPGFIKLKNGGQRLRDLYVHQSMSFQAMRLSPFGLCCYVGKIDMVRQEIEAGRAPDLEGTETPFEFGYATLVVAGAQRVQYDGTTKHMDVLKYLISCGLPVDVPDIAGLTALYHAVSGPSLQLALARDLLAAGADVNYQSRYGEVPLFGAFLKSHLAGIDLLMEFGADLDIKEADGVTPRTSMLSFGPQITATVQKWVRRRAGAEAPRVEKRCDYCGRMDAPLKNCSKCHVARYCSVECQRKAWSEHKKTCQSFSTSNTLTFKPFYEHGGSIIPTKELQNKFFGINTPTPETHHRSAHTPKRIDSESKNLVIKVQVPYDMVTNKPTPGAGPFFVYTKKRDFVCQIHRHDGPTAYDQLAQVIVAKGVGGSKAYFAAELKSKDELTVKISEVLAEQPF